MYIKYAKMTARFTPLTESGAVTTFITWSDKFNQASNGELHDELDYEILGARPTMPETNIFTYKSNFIEYGVHGGYTGNNITANQPHDFTIDWRSDRVDWYVDGKLFKSVTKAESRAKTPEAQMSPDEPWFPTSPSRIQLSTWESPSRDWAGGPVQFSGRPNLAALYEWVDVQCYDDNNNPVARWSASDSPVQAAGNPSTTTQQSTPVTRPAPPPIPSSADQSVDDSSDDSDAWDSSDDSSNDDGEDTWSDGSGDDSGDSSSDPYQDPDTSIDPSYQRSSQGPATASSTKCWRRYGSR
eukprot:jgi/Hompol1/1444/HPOL_001140-RA